MAGDRVDGVRGIADQREPFGGDLRGVVKAERVGRARRGQRDFAEESAHRRSASAAKSSSAQRQPARRVALPEPTRRSPSGGLPCRRSSAAARTARRDRKSRRRHGRAAFVAKRRDDRRMIIAPARDADPGGLAGRRIAAFGGDQQRRAQLPAVGRATTMTPCVAALDSTPLSTSTAATDLARPRPGRAARRANGGSRASSRAARRPPRFEISPPGVETVGNARSCGSGSPASGRWSADADRVEHAHRARRHRAGSAVETRPRRASSGSAGSTRIADRPLASSADASARPTIPPPEDDHVGPIHGRCSPSSRFSEAAIDEASASLPRLRLTGDSASKAF